VKALFITIFAIILTGLLIQLLSAVEQLVVTFMAAPLWLNLVVGGLFFGSLGFGIYLCSGGDTQSSYD